MSKLSVLFLLAVISCVSENKIDPVTVGNLTRFEPRLLSFEETEKVAAICRALASKEELLSILVTTGTEYNFSYAQKGCNDTALPLSKIVSTTIQTVGDSSYVFKAKENAVFGFPEVETSTKGVMAKICENLGNLMSPFQTSSSGATWFTVNTASERCRPDSESFCIHIQRGTIAYDVNYTIHTNEWIKFKMGTPNLGFFTERTLVSSAGCSDNKTIERSAVLK